MENIIDPIDVKQLEAELNPQHLLRKTNKGNNEIYVINQHNAPNVMNEIGRLREISFRSSGGGSGLSIDIDDYDTMENPYEQLIVLTRNRKKSSADTDTYTALTSLSQARANPS